ncbi:hypothetical protein NC653_016977 [Populus alba x Populus x berolinensis]|uniref:Uncharacterized protein n=1 Tax=Populus alba x Populus x berolinensis TaxID=444605 RepID=A0AAD6W0E3_9ROSI|nr:hypothetical protein NC653_016977 [Populus alba x Populus x berolinensis]
MYSRGKALVFSASLHHRVPSLYLFKIGQENPSRAFLRGQEKLEEKTYRDNQSHGFAAGGGGGGAAAASAAGGTWLGMLVLYLLGALRHVWPLS